MKLADYTTCDGLGIAEHTLLQIARQLEQAAPWPLNAPLPEQRS